MPEYVTPEEMHSRLMRLVKKRPDIGFKNTALNKALEPPNPFQPDSKRRLARGFILFLLLLSSLVSSFLYFNFKP